MANTTNFGWETPDDTDLVKDGAAAMRTLGNSIDASFIDLKGGTTGQVLSKNSNTDLDFTWVAQDDSNAIQNSIVDAKADLITATANDTPARLAVGNNGESLVADSSTSTGLRYQATKATQNAIINGAFDIWQRGTSFTTTSVYSADRWFLYQNTGSGATWSRQTGSGEFQYVMRVARNSGSTNTAGISIGQPIAIEEATQFAGKTVTLSFYAKAGANFSPTSSLMTVQFYSGTGTSDVNRALSAYTGDATVLNTTQAITTTLTRYSFTFTLGSTVTQFEPFFGMNPTGTAGANDWFEITGVQLEVGSVPTTFRRSGGTLAGELAACLYYFNRIADFSAGGSNGHQMIVTAQNFATTGGYGVLQYPRMRISPTVTFSGNADFFATSAGGSNVATTAMSANQIKPNSAEIRYTTAGSLAAGDAALLYTTTTAGKLDLSAEL